MAKVKRSNTPLSIRLKPEQRERLTAVAQKMGMTDSDVFRLACDIGLEQLQAIDYNLAKAIVAASTAQPPPAAQTAYRLNEGEGDPATRSFPSRSTSQPAPKKKIG